MRYKTMTAELASRWGLTMTQANKWLLAFESGKEKELAWDGDLYTYIEQCTGYPATLERCKELIDDLRNELDIIKNAEVYE